MAENIFLDEQGVLVTNARLVVGGTTYAVRLITSVRREVGSSGRVPSLICMAIGPILAWTWFSLTDPPRNAEDLFVLTFAGLFTAGGAVGTFILRTRHTVIVSTAGAERHVLTFTNSHFIDRVVAAIEKAIVSRG